MGLKNILKPLKLRFMSYDELNLRAQPKYDQSLSNMFSDTVLFIFQKMAGLL